MKISAIVIVTLALVVGGNLLAAGVRLTAGRRKKIIPREIDEAVLLHAIAEKESGNNPLAIGRLGERSKYQFTRDTWRLHSMVAFSWATDDPQLADCIAVRHLAYIRSVLRLKKIPETAANVAAAWHFGPNFARILANADYVHEVVNLYEEAVAR